MFLGYAVNSKAYRLYDLIHRATIESNDADFYEHRFPFKLKYSGGTTFSNTLLLIISEPEKVIEI